MSQPNSLVPHADVPTAHVSIVPDPIRVMSPDGRLLLRIGQDGAVEGAIEDAGDAAAIFLFELRRLLDLGALGPHIGR